MARQSVRTLLLVAVGLVSIYAPVSASGQDGGAGPETFVTSGPQDGAAVASKSVTFEFTGDGTEAHFECSLDHREPIWQVCASPFTADDLEEGRHTLEIRAVDGSGTADSTPEFRSFVVDTVGPETTIDSGPSPGSFVNPVDAVFEFSSDGAKDFQCHVDGQIPYWRDCTSPIDLTKLGHGYHEFGVRSFDYADNPDLSPASRGFTIDPGVSPFRPKVRLRVLRRIVPKNIGGLIRKGATVRARCGVDCLVTIRVVGLGSAAKLGNGKGVIAFGSRVLNARRAGPVRARLTKSLIARLRHGGDLGGKVRLKVAIRARSL